MKAGHVGEDAAMLAVALAGLRAGKSLRRIAVDLCGADRVAADWRGDSWMRATVQRLVDRARAAPNEGPDKAGRGTP